MDYTVPLDNKCNLLFEGALHPLGRSRPVEILYARRVPICGGVFGNFLLLSGAAHILSGVDVENHTHQSATQYM